MKKIINLFVTILAIVLITGCGCSKKENYDINKNLISEKKIDGFKITNTSLTFNNGISKLVSTVINESDESKYIKSFDIIVEDKEGTTIVILSGYIDDTIEPGGSRNIESNVTIDLRSAHNIIYQVKN